MFNENTVELIFTAEGDVKNIFFVEELVNSAPAVNGWMFTALKPALNIENVSIQMAGYEFNSKNISFYSNDDPNIPDEIDITVVHQDLDSNNKTTITNGVYIFLDNFLGELNFVTTIDEINVIGKADVVKELIPIEKLKDFLIWRQKEFIEKYEGVRHNTENDTYSSLKTQLKSGNASMAIINTDLLNWSSKASHPWVVDVEIKYDGRRHNGIPDTETYNLLNEIEDEILEELKDFDGYLNIGRQTAEGARNIYFACKDFRKLSKVLYQVQQKYRARFDVGYDIYKDKYWLSFNRFMNG
jgi:Family of unknown function (DUF695)